MDNIITVIDENGIEKEVEVLDIFTVNGYEDKEYILYTQNKEVSQDSVEVLVSILNKTGENSYSLLNIEDEREWESVQKAIDEMGDM